MAAVFPPIPRVIFTIIEPISLIAGAVTPLIDMRFFVSSQLPLEPVHPLYASEQVLALQLGNLYFLLCLVGLFVLNTTTESSVVRGYIWALWIADIGHVGATAWMLGHDEFVNVSSWNATAWGNIGFTAALCVARSLYLLGVFGKDRVPVTKAKKRS